MSDIIVLETYRFVIFWEYRMNIIAQCCGLIVLGVVFIFYRRRNTLRLYTENVFLGILAITTLSLIFDIASIIAIRYRNIWSVDVTNAMCKLYLCSMVGEATCALVYVCADVYEKTERGQKYAKIFYFYCIAAYLLIIALPINVNSIDEKLAYTYGPAVLMTYVLSIIPIVCIMIAIIHDKNRMNPKRHEAMCIWMCIWFASALVQFLNNKILFVGFACSIGVLVIYMKLENPETNLDRQTGLFNMNAFSLYLTHLQRNHKDVSILEIIFTHGVHDSISYETEQLIHKQIVNFVRDIPNTKIFLNSENDFLFIFDREEDTQHAIKLLEKRFEDTWGNEHLKRVSLEWFLIESTDIVERKEDVLPLFQYAKSHYGMLKGDCGTVVDKKMIQSMYRELEVESVIIHALNEKRVEVFYQPIFSVKEQKFTSAEALVRIRDEKGELVSPAEFIEVAEAKGLIIRLGEEVFRLVCKFIKENKITEYGIKYVEINLSMIQCAYENLATEFIQIMKEYEVDPKTIVLEITESASIYEKKVLLQNMKALMNEGVRFALDDFGTGQSNLNYIVEMPVNVVKFDRTMTNAYFENGTAKHVMDAAMQMIQGMNLQIVSEGIEEKEQYKVMKELGIDYIQGYYFSKPVEGDKFLDFIEEENQKTK